MSHHELVWSFNTVDQKQFKYDPAAEIVHKGPLIDVLDKLLPSMGRSDIPSHVVSIINFHGPGVLEMPGGQRWDGLRLHYRNDNVNLIIDYDAYKSDLSVTVIKPNGTITIDSVSELKLDKKFNEEDKMKDNKPEMTIPVRWMGESEINPEAIEYANLGEQSAEAGLVDTIEDGDMELHLRKELRRARDSANIRIGALGEPLGSVETVIKAKQALADYMRDKSVKLIVPDSERIGQIRTIDAADLFHDVGRLRDSAPRLAMLSVVSPAVSFDGDQMQLRIAKGRMRRPTTLGMFRIKNPTYKEFFSEGENHYTAEFRPLAVIKTDYRDYAYLVKLIRRDIYRAEMFLSPSLLIKALYDWPGIVRADRKTAMRFIKKTYCGCVTLRIRTLFPNSLWEHKEMVVRGSMFDGSKREFFANKPGMHRRQLNNDIRTCPTLTRQLTTGEDKDK